MVNIYHDFIYRPIKIGLGNKAKKKNTFVSRNAGDQKKSSPWRLQIYFVIRFN